MKDNEFKCYDCKEIFEKLSNKGEAEEEMLKIWGNIPKKERVSVCDDCFTKFMSNFN